MLASLKRYPGFMGDLTIEIQTTYKSLVIACVDSYGIMSTLLEASLSQYPEADLSSGSASGYTTNQTYDFVYNTSDGFVQINNAATNGIYYTSTTWNLASQTVTASTSTLQKFQLSTAVYKLKVDVYNAFEYNYLQVPLKILIIDQHLVALVR